MVHSVRISNLHALVVSVAVLYFALGHRSLHDHARPVVAALRAVWQEATRGYLVEKAERLAALLRQHGLALGGGCVLFQWTPTRHAAAIHERLARQGILTRLFTEPASLRFGLPGLEAGWGRLDQTLANACTELAPA